MATTNANLKRYAGGRDVWGGRGVNFFLYTGPTSYQGGAAGGDIVDAIGGPTTSFGAASTGLRNIEAIIPCISVSGNFAIEAGPAVAGTSGPVSFAAVWPPKRWLLRWRTFATGAEVANATNLSAETALLVIIGG